MSALIKKIWQYERHHEILFFSVVVIATILFVRVGVQFYNPNPILLNIELHHFDYGVILLLLMVKFLLFGSPKWRSFYLVFAAIGTGLVVDGYLPLRLTVVEPESPLELYNGTMGSVVGALVLGTLTVLFIRALWKRHATLAGHKR
jgi:hypothetical protein